MICLMPMKEHSERVPDKNIKILNGLPLFFYTADTVFKSKLFESLVINTDSKKISELAKNRYGEWVKIIDRPKHLVGDSVSMNLILEHDISNIGKGEHYFQTHSTNPLIKLDTIKESVIFYKNAIKYGEYDSVFSVNIFKSRLYNSKLDALNHDPNLLLRTQDLEIIYEENSNFYIFSGDVFDKTKNRIGLKPRPFICKNKIETIDIDDMSDWNLVEKIIKIY